MIEASTRKKAHATISTVLVYAVDLKPLLSEIGPALAAGKALIQ